MASASVPGPGARRSPSQLLKRSFQPRAFGGPGAGTPRGMSRGPDSQNPESGRSEAGQTFLVRDMSRTYDPTVAVIELHLGRFTATALDSDEAVMHATSLICPPAGSSQMRYFAVRFGADLVRYSLGEGRSRLQRRWLF